MNGLDDMGIRQRPKIKKESYEWEDYIGAGLLVVAVIGFVIFANIY